MDFDDIKPPPRPGAALGEDLSNLSVAELEQRIAALRTEIERVEAELQTKRSRQAAAQNLFKD
ncbi:MAG: hypothetical protein RLZ98_2375 [Pseudomonadota bacterium]